MNHTKVLKKIRKEIRNFYEKKIKIEKNSSRM